MSIAFDATATGAQTTNASITWSHTCTGSNRILVVLYSYATGSTTTTATYGGVAMTELLRMRSDSIHVFLLMNPASGTNTVSVNESGSGVAKKGISSSYTGTKQTSQPDSQGTLASANPTTSLSATTTTVDDNDLVLGFGWAGSTITAGASTTLRVKDTIPNRSDEYGILELTALKTPAGVATITVTPGANVETQLLAISIAPAVADHKPDMFLMFMSNK